MDVIWNLTRMCPWNCLICCVSAICARNKAEYLIRITQKQQGLELTLAEKFNVLKQLADRGFNVDFSGGDPLYYDEDFRVVE